MKNFKLALAAAAVAVSFSATVNAATDGSLGDASIGSTGTSDIILIKDNAVQITNVGDIDLGQASTLAADAVGGDDVCVFSSTGGYEVTVDSDVRAGAFNLESAGGDQMAYTVTWAANGGAAAPVTAGSAITSLAGDSSSLTCSGGTNARFEVTVDDAVFNAAAPGTYEDTVSLLVMPL